MVATVEDGLNILMSCGDGSVRIVRGCIWHSSSSEKRREHGQQRMTGLDIWWGAGGGGDVRKPIGFEPAFLGGAVCIIFKVFIELVTVLLLFMFWFLVFFFGYKAREILAPWAGIEPAAPALKGGSLNHQLPREAPSLLFWKHGGWCGVGQKRSVV